MIKIELPFDGAKKKGIHTADDEFLPWYPGPSVQHIVVSERGWNPLHWRRNLVHVARIHVAYASHRAQVACTSHWITIACSHWIHVACASHGVQLACTRWHRRYEYLWN